MPGDDPQLPALLDDARAPSVSDLEIMQTIMVPGGIDRWLR